MRRHYAASQRLLRPASSVSHCKTPHDLANGEARIVGSRYHAAMTRLTIAAVLIGIAFASMTAASMQTSPAGAVQDPFPEATGKAPLMKVCGNCHTAQTVIQTLRTRQEWSDVIDQMARFGAEANDQEFEQILGYLAKHFSPIKVNTAAAKDLETLLEVPADIAAAIVAYRGQNGEFKTIDDLKKVPGLEGSKVEAQKARILF
jgi:competence protein ComEA